MQTLKNLSHRLELTEPRQDPNHDIYGVCRGLGLRFMGIDLVGEGMGIGGVIGLAGRKALFPLTVETSQLQQSLKKIFHLNGLSIKFIGPLMVEKPYKMMRSYLSPLYIGHRSFRPFYTLLMAARSLGGLRSRYMVMRTLATVEARYKIDERSIDVGISVMSANGVNILIANELSGRIFTSVEVGGRRRGIPPWGEVCQPVKFHAPSLGLVMGLEPVDGCRMFMGREVLGKRLDWAGASYLLPRGAAGISYKVSFNWRT